MDAYSPAQQASRRAELHTPTSLQIAHMADMQLSVGKLRKKNSGTSLVQLKCQQKYWRSGLHHYSNSELTNEFYNKLL